MRLSITEQEALKIALFGVDFPIFLFGSRTNRRKRGGDIDILIFANRVSAEDRFDLSLSVTVKFQKLCDEKIDIVVLDSDALSAYEQAFLGTITKIPFK